MILITPGGWASGRRAVARLEEIRRFNAQSIDGQVFEVVEFQEWIKARSRDNPTSEIKGQKWLKLTNGRAVKFIEPGVYRIRLPGEERDITIREVAAKKGTPLMPATSRL